VIRGSYSFNTASKLLPADVRGRWRSIRFAVWPMTEVDEVEAGLSKKNAVLRLQEQLEYLCGNVPKTRQTGPLPPWS
jgi:hypothetical protein